MSMNVIDTDDYFASGISVLKFGGGEWRAEVPRWKFQSAHIFAKIRKFDQFGPLMEVISALTSQQVAVHVFAPYLPGLRQDRNNGGDTGLTARNTGRLLGGATTITTLDPHSRLGVDEFVRGHGNTGPTIRIVDPATYLPDILTKKYTHILVPDKGAVGRSTRIAEILGIPNIVKAHKKRDEATGRLSDFEIEDGLSSDSKNMMPRESRILLADDICDGGGMFIGLLEVLRKINYETPIDLFVSHGIFSRGFDTLLTGRHSFSEVITTNSWCIAPDTLPRLQVHNILPYYLGGLTP